MPADAAKALIILVKMIGPRPGSGEDCEARGSQVKVAERR
jgi:hypothetical protein